jgi:hypothetical protein
VWLIIAIAVCLLLAAVVALLTRKAPYDCPPGKAIVATVPRHSDASPLLATLAVNGIDTNVVEEPAKSLRRRLPGLLYALHRPAEPGGPWYVVVDAGDLPEAQRLLSADQG